MIKYISVSETAKLIRSALACRFPKTKFSVRSKSYAGGASIGVRWVDGPTEGEVRLITSKFEGATFNGMTDCKNYHTSELNGEPVHFGADFIVIEREFSDLTILKALEALDDQHPYNLTVQDYTLGRTWILPATSVHYPAATNMTQLIRSYLNDLNTF